MENTTQPAPAWPRALLFAFRFSFIYLVLYNLPFPLGTLPYTDFLAEKYQSLWHNLVPWVGKHVLHLPHDITALTNGSADTTYDYVLALCFFVLAFAVAILWSLLDRSRPAIVCFTSGFVCTSAFVLVPPCSATAPPNFLTSNSPTRLCISCSRPMEIPHPWPCFGFLWARPAATAFLQAAWKS